MNFNIIIQRVKDKTREYLSVEKPDEINVYNDECYILDDTFHPACFDIRNSLANRVSPHESIIETLSNDELIRLKRRVQDEINARINKG